MTSYVVGRHFFRRRARKRERQLNAQGIKAKVVRAHRAPYRWLVIRTFEED
jgi:hypothetical protein